MVEVWKQHIYACTCTECLQKDIYIIYTYKLLNFRKHGDNNQEKMCYKAIVASLLIFIHQYIAGIKRSGLNKGITNKFKNHSGIYFKFQD